MSEYPHNMMDYEKTYSEFKWNVPEYFNFATDVVDKWAEKPGKLALFWVDDHGSEVKRTFKEISTQSCRLANVLKENGVNQGDCVIIILPRLIEWWESMVACIRMGAIISPGTVQLTAKDIEFRIKSAKAVAIITDESNAGKVDEIAANCPSLKTKLVVGKREGWINYQSAVESAPADFPVVKTKGDDGALLFFTSGTTGYPKMTLHTHVSYPFAHKVTGKYWLDLREDDLHWNLSDTGWGKAAWSSLFGPWHQGTCLFVHHEVGKFNPKRMLELLQEYPITTLCAAPTIYRMLVLEDLSQYNFSSLRHCVGAGEPLNPEVIDTWRQHTGLTIRDGYGQTETVLVLGSFPCLDVRQGSMGKPTPGFKVAIIDETGAELPAGKEGDIAIEIEPEPPAGLFKEYWQDPLKTLSTRRGRWYVTGDRGVKDKDGYFWFVGRADDVILTAGYRVGPFEVESALIEHPAVAESAVVASPDELRGEIVKAFVVLAEGYEPSMELIKELKEHVKKATAPYKYPREIEFIEQLPKTVSGKIRRVQLRQMERMKKNLPPLR
ncbi:acetyl-CoA synthetase/medium-chain acyl-CoA synthetase [Desulfohalotomaculum tongense]|uniref:AMP-binding protein n=1 Tax=Desulforadius tongensis TaxID=1216062 RepID=UPI00195EA620|nr:AMP-binding protein [Desulforadius tongensis]MBM7854156.1 acetyl-CoA synthetase/medium-chain acyl-CoA synthetase [Desulforadius tongensis]